MPIPTLYVKNTCYFCRKVLDFAATQHIDLTTKDIISEPTGGEEIRRIGGKRQVPFLVDTQNGLSLYESDDIIDHLKRHYADKSARVSK